MITHAKTPNKQIKPMRQSGTQEPPIPKQNENGEGKVFYYGLIGTKDYYHKKNIKGKFSSGRFSSSDDKTQDLRPSKVYVSTSPAIRTGQVHSQYNRGGIVKLRQRKVKVTNRTYIEKVIVIQQWWRTVITRRTLLLSIKSQKEQSMLLETEGGIISLSKERTHRFEVNSQETPITKKIVFTTDYNIDSTEKKPQLTKSKEDDNSLMIKKVLPYSIDKVIKTNYDQYCQEYVLAQIKTKTPKEKTGVLKSKKKINDKALKSQMRELWIKESTKEGNDSFCIKEHEKLKEFSTPLVLQSRDHFDINGKKTLIESIGSNTINWNEEVKKDSDISLYLQRVYKMKNWNKMITKDKFSFDLINQYDEIKSNVYIAPIKRNDIQNQINYIQSQCNSISLNGKTKPNWNQSNFAERIEISVKHSKSQSQLSITPKPLSITYKPTELNKENLIYGIILTKEQLKQREKQLKIQHDHSNITLGPTYIYDKWNKVNKKYSEQSQKVFIKPFYKKANWNKTNNTSNIISNELLGRERERQMNQYIPNVQFMIETNPLIKVQKWKEIVNKTKQDSFNINRLYAKSDWNKTNKQELSSTFKEEGVEKDLKFLEDLFFSISAKKNDYEIIFTDKEKGKLFKLTKKDVMHLWNKMNMIDRINHDKCFISKEDEPKIIESKDKYDQDKYVPKQMERVKAAPGKRRDDEDLEIAEGNNFSIIRKPKAVKPISTDNTWNETCISENKSEHNIKLKGKQIKDKWNSDNKQSKDNNDIDYKGEDILSKWNKRNVQEKEKHNEISIKGIPTVAQPTTTTMDVTLIYNMWNKKNKPTDKEFNEFCLLGKDRKDLWNEQNKKDNDHHTYIPTLERVKEKCNKRNKRSQEEIIINYKGEDHKDKWNRLMAQENSMSTTLFIKGTKGVKIEKPNYNILFEYWNNNNKVIEEENSIKYPGENISERWNRENELDDSNEKIRINGLTYPNLFLVLQHWNKNNKAIHKENDICLQSEDYTQQEIKPVKEVKLKASKKPNKKLIEDQWNIVNEITNKDIDILCSGEAVKDKWNKRNKRDKAENEITIAGLTNPNILLILRHWNRQNKAKNEHNDLTYIGEDAKDKWNKLNKTKIEESDLAIIRDSIQDRWNKDNENEIQGRINIDGSRKPNIMLILEHWNKRSQIENESKLSINGEDLKIKWNKTNKKTFSDESNQLNIKGLRKPNYFILFEHWNNHNKKVEEENEICIIGESHKDKWNKLNDTDNELNQVNIKGSRNPNLILVWEYWMKQNKKVDNEIQFSIMKEDSSAKWNKTNELKSQLNNMNLEGSREPNIMLVLERWNKRKKIDNESDFFIHGEEAKDKWNKRNKHIDDNTINIEGSRKPNICLLIEHWKKQIQKIEEENALCFIGESQKDKWNKRSKPIEEETKVCVKGEDLKEKWNKLNKQSNIQSEISVKGSKNPNLFLILRHWNKNNKQIEEENELCILGEEAKDKWNKNNAQENSQDTNIHLKGSRKPNKVILVEYWNNQVKAIDKENELCIFGEDTKDKWNRSNAQENSKSNNIQLEGSRRPNKGILVEYWNKNNKKIEEENELCLLGEENKDKWNKNNAQENSQDTNIHFKGSRNPNKVLLIEYWNQQIALIDKENDLSLLGEDTKDKWNKNNAQENMKLTNIQLEGSRQPNKVILVEYWQQKSKAIDKETELCILGEDTKDKWNKNNAQENSQSTNIQLKGSRKPNKVILVEYWNSQIEAVDKENSMTIQGENAKEKWNKNNKQDSLDNSLFIKGSPDYNTYFILNQWKKRNIAETEKDNDIEFIKETHRERWNREISSDKHQLNIKGETNRILEQWKKRNKVAEKENCFSLIGKHNKDKWNEENKFDHSNKDLEIKGLTNPNIYLILQHWLNVNKKIEEENEVCILAEDQSNKWNNNNNVDTQLNELTYKGSQSPNIYLILQHWLKKNSIDDKLNEVHYIGQDSKDKWNKKNKTDNQSNDVFIEGSSVPNIYLLLKHWNLNNKKEERQTELSYLGEEKKKDKDSNWNDKSIIESSNEIKIKGSDEPNIWLIFEKWNKKNKLSETANVLNYNRDAHYERWNKTNIQEDDYSAKVNFIGEPCKIPHLELVAELWKKRNKRCNDDNQIQYKGVGKQSDWNKTNKEVIEISGFDIDNEYEPDRSQTTIHVLKTVKKTGPKPKKITLDFDSSEFCIESEPKTKSFPIKQQIISMNEELELIPPKEKPTQIKAMPSIRKEQYSKVSNEAFAIPKTIKPMNIYRIPSMTIEKVNKVKRAEPQPYIIEPSIQENIYKTTKSVNPMRFIIYDTWKDKVAQEQSLSFNIKGEQQKTKPIVIGKGIDNIKPENLENMQLLGKAKGKEIKDMTLFKLDGLEILNHKKKTRLNENKEKHNWDKEPLIFKNEPLELFSDESEEIKEKKEKLRRKNVIKTMMIEQNSEQLLSSPKRSAFAREKLLATNSEFKIDSKGKESVLLLWNKRNKIKEENKDFHISKDYNKPIQWNIINAIDNSNTYCINKKSKKGWNEQLEKNTHDILIPPQASYSKWNKKNVVDNFVYQIKGKKNPTWNETTKIEKNKEFNIKEKPLKDKWNKFNTNSSSVTYTIQGTPRSKKWIKDNSLTKMQYSSIGVPKPAINKWLSSNQQAKDTRFNLLSKPKKSNEIKKESDVQMISKPRKRASNQLIKSSSFTIDPNKKVVLAKVNQKNKIAKSVVNETIKGQALKKQWSTKTLYKQQQSMAYQGIEKENWNKVVKKVTKERMTLERTDKNWNDIFKMQSSIKFNVKPTQITKKKTIIPLNKIKVFEYQYPDPNNKKDPSLLIRYTISETKKQEMNEDDEDEDEDDDILNKFKTSKKIIAKIKIQTPSQSKHEVKEDREILPVKQQTNQSKLRVRKKDKEKEFSATVTAQQHQNYANKQKEYEDSSGRKTDPYKKIEKGPGQQNETLKNIRNILNPSKNSQKELIIRDPYKPSALGTTDK